VEEHGESTATSVGAAAAQARRRWVSEYDEVVDGGYGWGSAAPVWDGAMPLGHPVKANKQWMKFQEPADGWYDKMHADVWFVDADTARRFGFTKD
ncbi:MAG TPA: 50S ribosomal protein L17, partial [Dermatophilaceae bacterium]|nr:50S ribosomal protein L17 [Dermatophilaceae bacterium]HPZ70305.1 50S ribosomal protein L17 [Dermatophilaceae bacterium]